jgi:cobalt/nickel transport system permease protein
MFFISIPTSHFSLLTLTGHKDGLMEGIRITSRIMGGVSLVIALGFSTPFIEFVAALSWLRVPRPFIEIMMFAYRYLFVFFEDASTIYSAQKNRLGYAGIRKSLISFGVLTGSWYCAALNRARRPRMR